MKRLAAFNDGVRNIPTTVVFLGLLTLCLPAVLSAQVREGSSEQLLFDAANRERTTRGLPALTWDAQLAAAAQKHAALMARQNALSHQLPGEPDTPARAKRAGARFSALAENVAFAPTAPEIHNGWMTSPPHRQNLLNPQMNAVGIAVVPRGDELFAVEDFSRTVAVLSLEEQESRVGTQLKARGILVLSDRADARSVCQLGPGHGTGGKPSYMVRYTVTDFDKLPDGLTQLIHSGRYHSAEVGACPLANTDDFAEYQIAVVLYE